MLSYIFVSLILPKCAKTSEHKDECCVFAVHPCTCDTLPLDNSKTYSHPALPYITWGLIQDLKNKIRDPN